MYNNSENSKVCTNIDRYLYENAAARKPDNI